MFKRIKKIIHKMRDIVSDLFYWLSEKMNVLKLLCIRIASEIESADHYKKPKPKRGK
jgi:hypothetical protein